MDGVFRVVRWVMRGFDAADSERTVRPESPTSSNVEIGPPYPMLAGGLRLQAYSHRTNLNLSK